MDLPHAQELRRLAHNRTFDEKIEADRQEGIAELERELAIEEAAMTHVFAIKRLLITAANRGESEVKYSTEDADFDTDTLSPEQQQLLDDQNEIMGFVLDFFAKEGYRVNQAATNMNALLGPMTREWSRWRHIITIEVPPIPEPRRTLLNRLGRFIVDHTARS